MLLSDESPASATRTKTRLEAITSEPLPPSSEPAALPDPVYPRFPERCGDVPPDPRSVPRNRNPYRTRVTPFMIRRAVDWLHDTGCRVLALMGGEVLLRPQFRYNDRNSTYITKKDWPRIDAVVDWLIEKNRSGYKMVNSVARLGQMKQFMRGKLQDWNCRAGQNALIIRTDGTLAPCFPMYSATCDWGVVGKPNFDVTQLTEVKRQCQPHCFSTLNHNLAYCYDAGRAFKWLMKQALNGFHGTTGSFEE